MPPKRTIDTTARSEPSDDELDESLSSIDNEDLFKQMICASVQYILIHSSKTQTIKKADWISTVLRPLTTEARKYFPLVHKVVLKNLQQTFGYRLVTNEKQDGESKERTNGRVQFVLLQVIFSSMVWPKVR